MISNRFIKCVPKMSEVEDKNSTTAYRSKMPFFCSQEGVKGKLAHTCLTCYLECISYHLPTDTILITERICKECHNPCI